MRRFGSLSKTVPNSEGSAGSARAIRSAAAVGPQAYTLVQAMLGGFNWGEVADVLMDVDVNLGFHGWDLILPGLVF